MIQVFVLQAICGYLTDLLVGDPPRIPHPVVMIGRGIVCLEKVARYLFSSPAGLKVAGAGIALVIPVLGYVITIFILWAAGQVSDWFALLLGAWLVSTTMATRGLAEAAQEIKFILTKGDLAAARQRVGWIVGRDTVDMPGDEIVRATVETTAENTVDAVVAPLFYACIGGPPLAMAYRAINTLDSMLGYKNEKYLHLGWASARLDDIAGYLPARITGIFMVMAAWLANRNWRGALACWKRDAALHPSPNSGIPESIMAGALGVRLGGANVYGGAISFRPYLGDQVELLRPDHIDRATHMLYLTAAIAALGCPVLVWAVYRIVVG